MEESQEETRKTSTETSKPKLGLIVGILILVAAGVGAYFAFGRSKGSNVPSTNSTSPAEVSETPQNLDVKTFEITGESYSFTPSSITVKKGDSVKINFTSKNGKHDLVVDGYNVRTKVLNAGKTDTIEFVADRQGTFEFYCSVANHKSLGMVGTFIVE